MAKLQIFKGDNFSFSLFLTQPTTTSQSPQPSYLLFLSESTDQSTHVLAGTETVTVSFNGQAGVGSPVTRTIGTGVAFGTLSNGELVISGTGTQSALMLQGLSQAIDVVVTTAGGVVTTYERALVLDVKARSVS